MIVSISFSITVSLYNPLRPKRFVIQEVGATFPQLRDGGLYDDFSTLTACAGHFTVRNTCMVFRVESLAMKTEVLAGGSFHIYGVNSDTPKSTSTSPKLSARMSSKLWRKHRHRLAKL